MISDKALQEFKKIWKEEIGEDISDEKAMEEGTSLLTLFNVIYRPVKKEWLKKLDDKDNAVNKADEKEKYQRLSKG